jgi:hypothetical protein
VTWLQHAGLGYSFRRWCFQLVHIWVVLELLPKTAWEVIPAHCLLGIPVEIQGRWIGKAASPQPLTCMHQSLSMAPRQFGRGLALPPVRS